MSRNIHPRKVRRDYFKSRRGDIKESSLRSYEYPTKHLIEFLETQGIENMSNVDGYIMEQWKLERKDENVKPITLHNNVKHVKTFINWCESIEVVQDDLSQKIEVPEVTDEQEASQESVSPELADRLLDYLEKYEYATRRHALFYFLWHTGCRISSAIALDLKDFKPAEKHVKFRNRPQTDTGLKNGQKGERNVTLDRDVIAVINDYIEARRNQVTDDHERKPLFTTSSGRITRQPIYKDIVALTRPCVYTDNCPHDREIESCEAATLKKKAFDCPSSTSLHPIRRGSITYHLNQGWPKRKVSNRCDLTVRVLEKHYDVRTEEDQRQQRREYVDKL